MDKTLKSLLIVWGATMSIIVAMLTIKIIQLDDVVREEVNLAEERNAFYKKLFVREAIHIDELNVQVNDLRDEMKRKGGTDL